MFHFGLNRRNRILVQHFLKCDIINTQSQIYFKDTPAHQTILHKRRLMVVFFFAIKIPSSQLGLKEIRKKLFL